MSRSQKISRSLCWPATVLITGFVGAGVLCSGCGSKDEAVPPNPLISPAQLPRVNENIKIPPVRFTDITAKAGIRFRHCNGAFGKKLLPETMGSGVAFIDFDNDGHQDLLFVNSSYWPGHEDASRPAPTLALYRNQGDGSFADVTKACGLDGTLFGMGVAVGDFDNDGWPDIFITGMGGNRLFRNVADAAGGRRFLDVTAVAGDLGP